MAKKKSKKKKKHLIGKKEFIFNFLSLVFMISVGIYFGYRSLYYYSKQNMKQKEEANTLNGLIVNNNKVVSEGDGLHRDEQGYYFKGKVTNNYLVINNQLFRVLRVNTDNSVKVVGEYNVSSFMWGDDISYKDSNVRNWLEKNDNQLSGVYSSFFSGYDNYLIKTKCTEEILEKDKIVKGDTEYNDYFSIPSIRDYTLSGGKSGFLNNGNSFFLLGFSSDKENIYVDSEGAVSSCSTSDGFGIKVAFTIKGNTNCSGNGTIETPYSINFEGSKYLNSYVKLGDDIWVVYNENGDILRLALNDYIKKDGEEVLYKYSDFNSIFDLKDKNSLAFYLNNVYNKTLTYRDLLLDTDYYVGEISTDMNYNYYNIFNNKVTCKVGLLNIFDYIPNAVLTDYYYINTTSQVGSMEYVRLGNGELQEADVRDKKHIVPTISINKTVLTVGSGTVNDPYMVG